MTAQLAAGPSQPASVRRPGRLSALARAESTHGVVLGALGIGIAICAMELITKSGLVESRDVPPAFDIINLFLSNLGTVNFWHVVGQTMIQWVIGFSIALAFAFPLGMAIGASNLLWRALRPTIEFLRPVPPVAFLALLILLYGPTAKSAIVLVVFGSMWSLLIQAIYGMRDRDEVMLDTARSLRIGWWTLLRSVTIPSVLPYLATGIRLGAAYALIGCISAEVLVSSPGLGKEVWLDFENGATTLAYSYVLASGLIGLALHVVSTRFEKRYLNWHFSQREITA
ncbi:MAG TPA: ABC transporter permease [Solirubrobacteraceae bacterium]|jgi:ABC-type nitrate/sulfonate/bicarbonate transport system permease component|nr:ABC transporter permease [Solirubrobacteraceae bacterium]